VQIFSGISSIGSGTLIALAATVAAGALGQQNDTRVLSEEVEELRATVSAVDRAQRLVTLRGADGTEVTLEAGEEIRNFDQIDVGDTVLARFYEGLAAEVTSAPPGAEPGLLAAERAAVGERPSGAVAFVYTAVVAIESVDRETNVVKFTDAEGRHRQLAVQRPEMQRFVATLQPGDHVKVTYGGGLAIELEPN
jgi:hypothetical protein